MDVREKSLNEKRLIDVDAFLEKMKRTSRYFDVVFDIEEMPTVNAVEVVRCNDCKHLCVWNQKDIYAFCPKTNIVFLPFDKDTRTFFCSLGERKDEANES